MISDLNLIYLHGEYFWGPPTPYQALRGIHFTPVTHPSSPTFCSEAHKAIELDQRSAFKHVAIYVSFRHYATVQVVFKHWKQWKQYTRLKQWKQWKQRKQCTHCKQCKQCKQCRLCTRFIARCYLHLWCILIMMMMTVRSKMSKLSNGQTLDSAKFHRQSRNFPDLQKLQVKGLSRRSFQCYTQKPSGRAKTFQSVTLTIFLGLCDNDEVWYDNGGGGGDVGVGSGMILMWSRRPWVYSTTVDCVWGGWVWCLFSAHQRQKTEGDS